MWVCLNDSFLSIVAHRDQPDMLCVRARVRGHIERVFPFADVQETPDGDYLFRAVINRQAVANAIASRAFSITYDNFKNSVPDRKLHDAYLDFWSIMCQLQMVLFGKRGNGGGHGSAHGGGVRRNLLDRFW